jgi:ribosome-associated toxin RatA of RatAB toxin-antitoxin module
MIGWPLAFQCAVACFINESSQQPMWPQAAQRRRCTHQPPDASHSTQPVPLGTAAGSISALMTQRLLSYPKAVRPQIALDRVPAMATSDSREVVIEATPAEILDVIADVEATPDWSPQYQKAVILESFPDGRPKQVEMTVKAAGLTDVMVIEYTWTDSSVAWRLVKSGQLKAQDASYTFTPAGGSDQKTRVRFDMKIDLSIPMPGFILKRTLKGGMETATDGLRKQVLKVKKG